MASVCDAFDDWTPNQKETFLGLAVGLAVVLVGLLGLGLERLKEKVLLAPLVVLGNLLRLLVSERRLA